MLLRWLLQETFRIKEEIHRIKPSGVPQSMAKYNVYVVISDFKDFGDEGKKAACYSVNIYQPTKRKIPEDLNLHQDSGESSIFFFGREEEGI